jgi:hypothetical protein
VLPQNHKCITVSEQIIKSLPLWYQALASVMQEKGEMVIQNVDKSEVQQP